MLQPHNANNANVVFADNCDNEIQQIFYEKMIVENWNQGWHKCVDNKETVVLNRNPEKMFQAISKISNLISTEVAG